MQAFCFDNLNAYRPKRRALQGALAHPMPPRKHLVRLRQRVAAIGRRSATPCKRQEGLGHQLALFQVYHNFVLPHASLRQALAAPLPTNGTGSAKVWRPCTPAMAAGLTDHVWTLRTMPSQYLSIDNSNDRAARGG